MHYMDCPLKVCHPDFGWGTINKIKNNRMLVLWNVDRGVPGGWYEVSMDLTYDNVHKLFKLCEEDAPTQQESL